MFFIFEKWTWIRIESHWSTEKDFHHACVQIASQILIICDEYNEGKVHISHKNNLANVCLHSVVYFWISWHMVVIMQFMSSLMSTYPMNQLYVYWLIEDGQLNYMPLYEILAEKELHELIMIPYLYWYYNFVHNCQTCHHCVLRNVRRLSYSNDDFAIENDFSIPGNMCLFKEMPSVKRVNKKCLEEDCGLGTRYFGHEFSLSIASLRTHVSKSSRIHIRHYRPKFNFVRV